MNDITLIRLLTMSDMADTAWLKGKIDASTKRHINQVFRLEIQAQLKDNGRVLKWKV